MPQKEDQKAPRTFFERWAVLPAVGPLLRKSYFSYKRRFEDPFQNLAIRYPKLFSGGHIVDAGAGWGYNTILFAKLADPGFRVLSFEPAAGNAFVLKAAVHSAGLENRVDVIESALGETDGKVAMAFRRIFFTDHQVARNAGTIPSGGQAVVPMARLDSWLAAHRPWEKISFIKIDVQGYEGDVCAGMERTLAANETVAVAFELTPSRLKGFGRSAAWILSFFKDRKFQIYRLNRTGPPRLFSDVADFEGWDRAYRYTDFLAVRRPLEISR